MTGKELDLLLDTCLLAGKIMMEATIIGVGTAAQKGKLIR